MLPAWNSPTPCPSPLPDKPVNIIHVSMAGLASRAFPAALRQDRTLPLGC